MIYQLLKQYPNLMMIMGIIYVFFTTLFLLRKFMHKLPCDEGRDYAVDGKLSKGKPRGAGIIFIINFFVGVLLFSPVNLEYLIYAGLVFIEMMTGYLDDKAEVSWGRVKKGLMDLLVAMMLAAVFLYYNGHAMYIFSLTESVVVPTWIYFIGIVILAWLAINTTNCADGVDGLSGILTIITLLSFYFTDLNFIAIGRFSYIILFFIASLLGYLWFNANPSLLMMGDAGSRAMGMFIAIVALKSHVPVLYIPFAIILLLDGGLGLFKVSFIKVFKVNPLKNIRTPLHDHVRKNLKENWSNNQVVIRFAIIQVVISFVVIFLLLR